MLGYMLLASGPRLRSFGGFSVHLLICKIRGTCEQRETTYEWWEVCKLENENNYGFNCKSTDFDKIWVRYVDKCCIQVNFLV